MKSATCNFDDNFVIGAGGFGNVYKGHMDNSATTVVIKHLNPSSNQGVREFQTEIELLSKLRHLHLVLLIGYCNDNHEMILVYDYMAHGTLCDHLYKSKKPPLPWKQRLKICIGTTKGLHYLNTGAKRTIIHRDVKSTNILLDEKWVAKISDFGLSKLGLIDAGHNHVNTMVKEKSDVYSFGVVLFEVLCARLAIILDLPEEQVNLAKLARHCYKNGTLDQIVDPNIREEIAPECLKKFGELGYSYLRKNGFKRSGINNVLWGLEFALQLQEEAEMSGLLPAALASLSIPPLHGESTTNDDENVLRSTANSDKLKNRTLLSKIMNPTGR
ncbi:unnamed protein product [Ilex paraguariensis]|uniref:Protein kinase domain-containing protein n=1 Tax=Ilex paraguariensis TaxID=185542 RepID=A0ABC8R9L3_9AQUA